MSNESETKPSPRRGRRFLRFSLRGLLVVVAICSVWLGIAFHRAREQAQLVSLIESSGGHVLYDYHEVDSKFFVNATSRTPAWLLDSLGVDFFHDVTHISVYKANDELLERVCDLPEIHSLYLYDSTVTNEEIAQLKKLTSLRELQIDSPNVDDRGLKEVGALSELRILQIVNSPVSDRGLDHLQALPRIKFIGLINTAVTPAGVAELGKALPNCAIDL
jgi:hypothetical protein